MITMTDALDEVVDEDQMTHADEHDALDKVILDEMDDIIHIEDEVELDELDVMGVRIVMDEQEDLVSVVV